MTLLRRAIIQKKTFLRRIYEEWYGFIISNLPEGDDRILELGSGGGFLDQILPHLITSEVFFCPTVKVVADGASLPFTDGVLRSVVMVDVFHHSFYERGLPE